MSDIIIMVSIVVYLLVVVAIVYNIPRKTKVQMTFILAEESLVLS